MSNLSKRNLVNSYLSKGFFFVAVFLEVLVSKKFIILYYTYFPPLRARQLNNANSKSLHYQLSLAEKLIIPISAVCNAFIHINQYYIILMTD